MITIQKGNKPLEYKGFVFPGGEIGLKLNAGDYNYRYIGGRPQTVIARIQNSADFMELAMAKDALARLDPKTDSGMKKSAKGLLRVDLVDGIYTLKDCCTPEEEKGGELKEVFRDGKLLINWTLAEIRARVQA